MKFNITEKVIKAAEEMHVRALSSNRRLGSNLWVEGKEGKVFIRVTSRALPELGVVPTLDFASINIYEKYQRQGVFKEVLGELSLLAVKLERSLFLESVIDDNLLRFLKQSGLAEVPYAIPPSFYKPLEVPTAKPVVALQESKPVMKMRR